MSLGPFPEAVPALLHPSWDEGTSVWVLVHRQPHSSKMRFNFFSAPFLTSHLVFWWLLSASVDPSVITPAVTRS